MSPDRLGTALRDLVDDVEDGATPPVADELWAGGRRRRRTARLVPAVAGACVAALVGLTVWPSGAPRASVPAVRVDDGAVRLTSYPSVIPKPPIVTATQRPGVTAAVVGQKWDNSTVYAVSPAGTPRRAVVPDPGWLTPPALSPDGRWLARGSVLSDLVDGVTLPSEPVRATLSSTRMPSTEPAWWSPDSRRVYVDAVNQGKASSSGVVVATDGTVTDAPLLTGGQAPVVAGWLDDETVLAFVALDGSNASLSGRTWRVGDPTWEVSGPDLVWPSEGEVEGSPVEQVRAALSPDATRVLLTRSVTDPQTSSVRSTRALLFDARTGAQLGMPAPDGSLVPASADGATTLEWGGWGCRPAWRHGLPVTTDERIRGAVIGLGADLVKVSSRYDSPCVAFAGNELRGTPAVDTVAVWQERLWVWGGRLLVLAGIGALVWWVTRRRGWREGPGTEPPPYFLPSRG